MNILVSTDLTQGQRKNDFCFTKPGEILTWASECDGEKVDGKCGCRRSMVGITSRLGTTTIAVTESPYTLEEFFNLILEAAQKAYKPIFNDDEILTLVNRDVKDLVHVADSFEPGSILEKRGNAFYKRG